MDNNYIKDTFNSMIESVKYYDCEDSAIINLFPVIKDIDGVLSIAAAFCEPSETNNKDELLITRKWWTYAPISDNEFEGDEAFFKLHPCRGTFDFGKDIPSNIIINYSDYKKKIKKIRNEDILSAFDTLTTICNEIQEYNTFNIKLYKIYLKKIKRFVPNEMEYLYKYLSVDIPNTSNKDYVLNCDYWVPCEKNNCENISNKTTLLEYLKDMPNLYIILNKNHFINNEKDILYKEQLNNKNTVFIFQHKRIAEMVALNINQVFIDKTASVSQINKENETFSIFLNLLQEENIENIYVYYKNIYENNIINRVVTDKEILDLIDKEDDDAINAIPQSIDKQDFIFSMSTNEFINMFNNNIKVCGNNNLDIEMPEEVYTDRETGVSAIDSEEMNLAFYNSGLNVATFQIFNCDNIKEINDIITPTLLLKLLKDFRTPEIIEEYKSVYYPEQLKMIYSYLKGDDEISNAFNVLAEKLDVVYLMMDDNTKTPFSIFGAMYEPLILLFTDIELAYAGVNYLQKVNNIPLSLKRIFKKDLKNEMEKIESIYGINSAVMDYCFSQIACPTQYLYNPTKPNLENINVDLTNNNLISILYAYNQILYYCSENEVNASELINLRFNILSTIYTGNAYIFIKNNNLYISPKKEYLDKEKGIKNLKFMSLNNNAIDMNNIKRVYVHNRLNWVDFSDFIQYYQFRKDFENKIMNYMYTNDDGYIKNYILKYDLPGVVYKDSICSKIFDNKKYGFYMYKFIEEVYQDKNPVCHIQESKYYNQSLDEIKKTLPVEYTNLDIIAKIMYS